MDYHQKKKFFWDSRQYFWDEPYLYKKYGDGLLRRYIPDEKISEVLMHFHSLECEGYASSTKTIAKVLQSRFY